MCTSLIYKDAAGKTYFGRTLELTVDLPYQVAFLPPGHAVASEVPGHPALEYVSRHRILAVTMPVRVPTKDAPVSLADLKVLEGFNDKGLTFSVLSYPTAAGKAQALDPAQPALAVPDLGTWSLGQFATVAEVKAALAKQQLAIVPLEILGGAPSPFHYVLHDATGASIVVEFDHGELTVYDNPVGVMTNGPRFSWHLTNLDNYTFLSNVDKPVAQFGEYKAAQPDSGIATSGLPASNTSVGRFVRAVYYATFTEKAASPDGAVQTLAHILNNFDRPRGATIDYPDGGGGHLEVQGLDSGKGEPYATEFTSWTSMSDLDRQRLFVRDYRSINFASFDLAKFAATDAPAVIPLERVRSGVWDASDVMTGPKTA
jgi:penicillin V acylase-like amidase (Ntn superfamily)